MHVFSSEFHLTNIHYFQVVVDNPTGLKYSKHIRLM